MRVKEVANANKTKIFLVSSQNNSPFYPPMTWCLGLFLRDGARNGVQEGV